MKTYDEVSKLLRDTYYKPEDGEEAHKKAARLDHDKNIKKLKWLIIDYAKDQVECQIGADIDQEVWIEASLTTDAGEQDQTARYATTWNDLCRQLTPALLKGKNTSVVQLHLRDGISPAALLMAEVEFSNVFLKKPKAAEWIDWDTPKVFDTIFPGRNYNWGEVVTLAWETDDNTAPREVDVVLISDILEKKEVYKHVPAEKQDKAKKCSKMKSKVSLTTGKVAVPMCTAHSPYMQKVSAYMELRASGTNTVLQRSPDFVVSRPVTMSNLETAYASFCIRNNIAQKPMNEQILKEIGIDIQEREYYVATGYRQILPIPNEAKYQKGEFGIIVNDPGALLITQGVKKSVSKFDFAENKKAKKALKSGKSTGLAEPLLGNAPAAEKQDKDKQMAPINPSLTRVKCPTNVFWKFDEEWQPDQLLFYSMLPDVATNYYIKETCKFYEMEYTEKVIGKLDDVIRLLLDCCVWFVQWVILFSPMLWVIVMIVAHDLVYSTMRPNLDPIKSAKVIYFSDFVIDARVWRIRYLEQFDEYMLITLLVTWFALLAMTFVSNFLRYEHWFERSPLFAIHKPLNIALAWGFAIMVYIILVYISVVTVWILLGSLINPQALMPYAIMLAGIILLVKTQLGNLTIMKDQAEERLMDFMNASMHAMLACFVGDTSAGPWLDMAQESEFARQVAEMVENNEQATTKALLAAAPDIITTVGGCEIDRINLLRESAAFAEGVNTTPNKCLASDFVLAGVLPFAQGIANDAATINGKRVAADANGVQGNNDMTQDAFSKGISALAAQNVPAPGQITADQQTELDSTAEKLKMRPETASILSQAFTLATHLRTSDQEKKLLEPASCSAMMSDIRENQLFKHFLGAENKETGKKDDSTANKLLREIQKQEMESFSGVLASSLTRLVDWTAVSRTCAEFMDHTLLNSIIASAVDTQLNQFKTGTAAFDMMLKVYDIAFSKFKQYNEHGDFISFFVDVGLISEDYSAKPECKALLQGAIDAQKAFDGSLCPDALIAAVSGMFLPSLREGNAVTVGEVPEPLYLWFDALKRILATLGWTKEEMDEVWLKDMWTSCTPPGGDDDNKGSTGLFYYMVPEKITSLITQQLTDGGMWKAATKCMMYEVKLASFACCDASLKKGDHLSVDSKDFEKASAMSKKILAQATPIPLQWLSDECPWPKYIEKMWVDMGEPVKSKQSTKGPSFLHHAKVMDFLQDVIYIPVKEVGEVPKGDDAFAKLNSYPDDVSDLQWAKTPDGALWHDMGGSTKRRLRGIWHELAMDVFQSVNCVPNDNDVYYDCLKYQWKNWETFSPQAHTHKVGIYLRPDVWQTWLDQEYLPKQNEYVTFAQFNQMLSMLNCILPADVLEAQVFKKCPLVPGDDNGELRKIGDCAAGLRMWMGYGIWQAGVKQLVEKVMVIGPLRTMALASLPSEFAQQDSANIGVVQPAQAVVLMHSLAHPGLTCEDLAVTVKTDLGLDINEREFHHYFTTVDVNCDGVLGLTEFIPFIRLMLFDYFPSRILDTLKLSPKFIAFLIINIVLLLVFIFLCVTLVIKTFAEGTNISSAIHSSMSAMTVAGGKVQGEADSGFNDSVSAVKAALEGLIMTTLTVTLGLAPQVIDAFKTLVTQLSQGLPFQI
jgi:hypothetical protein